MTGTSILPLHWSATVERLEQGATLLTVNRRLALTLARDFARQRVESGHQVWETPDILTWDAWQTRLHGTLLERGQRTGSLLSDAESALLWEEIIASDDQSKLLNHADLARLAMDTHALVEQWQLPRELLADQHKPEARRFLRWLGRFDLVCQRHDWSSSATLTRDLTDALSSMDTPQNLILAGFDSYPPAQQVLLTRLRELGCELSRLSPLQPDQATGKRLARIDAGAELAHAAAWARDRLRANPGARIGLVIPDLAARRDEVEHVLSKTLQPHRLPPGEDRGQALFSVAAPPPLVDQALIADALRLLSLVTGTLDFEDLGPLLRSPFLGGSDTEADARHRLEASLRDHGEPRYHLARLLQVLPALAANLPCPDLPDLLRRLQGSHSTRPRTAAPADWALHFQHLLHDAGWPGEQGQDSETWQLAERFYELLDKLAGLGRVRGRISATQALALLRRLAREERFLAAAVNAPIQVIGLLETAGQSFDHLWVLGLNDTVLPAPAMPNPLLPASLQRDLDMPHCSAAHELGYAQRLLKRLRGAAPEVVLSYCDREQDRELRPSPLLNDLPDWQPNVGQPDQVPARTVPLEQVSDWIAPATTGYQSGGSGLLSAQAACPFSALAEYRWQGTGLEEVSHAPDPRMTGSLLHDCLHRIWQQLRDLDRLRALNDDTLSKLLDNAASQALAPWRSRRPDLYTDTYTDLERQRLTSLLRRWLLDHEAERAPFSLERAEQRQRTCLANGIEITLIADRIDRLPDGRLIVIDYKSGRSASSKGWFQERVLEPQVPLYCIDLVGQGETIAGAALAKLVSQDEQTGFDGTCVEPDLLPGVRAFQPDEAFADWDALLGHWRDSLNLLASEIADGRADPTPSRQACQYCELAGLCRRHEWEHADPSEASA